MITKTVPNLRQAVAKAGRDLKGYRLAGLNRPEMMAKLSGNLNTAVLAYWNELGRPEREASEAVAIAMDAERAEMEAFVASRRELVRIAHIKILDAMVSLEAVRAHVNGIAIHNRANPQLRVVDAEKLERGERPRLTRLLSILQRYVG